MEFQNLFENPLPIIKSDVEKIVFNINGIGEGYIHIENIGGGILKGEILSNTNCICFDKNSFETNDISLRYEVDTSFLSQGDRIKSNIVIISTGGELNIPVVINVMAKPFLTADKTEIFTLKDFYAYAKNNKLEARRILCSNDFMLWLKLNGFEHIDVLEDIIEDADKERALDNFFVLSEVKKKANIQIEKNIVEYKIKNNSDSVIKDCIKIKKIGLGYINAKIYKKNNSDWLIIHSEKLVGKDFDENRETELNFEILTDKIEKNTEEEIIIETDKKISVKIRAIKLPKIRFKVNKQCFSFEDKGQIYIENYTGEKMLVEIKASDSSIRFEKESLVIEDSALIDFKVKTSGIIKNMLEIQKSPYLDAVIALTAKLEDNTEVKFEEKIIIGVELD